MKIFLSSAELQMWKVELYKGLLWSSKSLWNPWRAGNKVVVGVKYGPQSFLINLLSETQESWLLLFWVEVSVVCNWVLLKIVEERCVPYNEHEAW